MSDQNPVSPASGRQPSAEDLVLAPPVRLGTMLVSLVEPQPGMAADFARWYERDHFFAGCMAGADFFSGRRFVATADLKQDRIGTGVGGHTLSAGSFLNLYAILDGRREQVLPWSVDQVRRLARQGRMGPPTTSMATGFHALAGEFTAPTAPIPAELALEYPYRGLAAIWLTRGPDADDAALIAALQDALSPILSLPHSLALWLTLLPLPANAPRIAAHPTTADLAAGRLLLLFADLAPDHPQWTAGMRALEHDLADGRLARIDLAARFRPITPGIDDYSNRL